MKEAPRWGSLAILSTRVLGIGGALAIPVSDRADSRAENAGLGLLEPDRGAAWDGAFPAVTGDGWRAPVEGATYTGRDGNEWRPAN